VNRWDPLRLIESECPEDEYDCISQPLVGMLSRNAADSEVFTRLDQIIQEHFGDGGTPLSQAEGCRSFLDGLRAEWTASAIRVTRK
jgi:hypothetical protein